MKLTYYPFCPFSRAVRISLLEKNLDFSLEVLNPLLSDEKVLVSSNINVPLLQHNKDNILSSFAQQEYLEDRYPATTLYPDNNLLKAESRRLISWFDSVFFSDVSHKLITEKVLNRLNDISPSSQNILKALNNLTYHLEYIEYLTSKRKWLACNDFSMADIVAGSHLSIIDYLGDIKWDEYENAKEWYMKLKSRPSFRAILEDKITDIVPSKNYRNLDF